MAFSEVPAESRRTYSMGVFHINGVSFEITTGISQYEQGPGDQAALDLEAYLNAWPQRDPAIPTVASKIATHSFVADVEPEPTPPEQ